MNDELSALLEQMSRERERLLSLVAPLDRGQMGAARRGGWSVGRVLHHVIEAEVSYAKVLAHQRGQAIPELEAREPADGADVAAQLATTREAVCRIVDGIDDDTLYRLVRLGHEEYSPLSVLENIGLHDREHYAQLVEILGGAAPRRSQGSERGSPSVRIRHATDGDLARITEIYNHYVVNTPITFDLEPFTVEQRREWLSHYAPSGRHRLLVAEDGGVIAGYACSSRFHPRMGYETTVEMTVVCAPEAVGRGIGRRLYEQLFGELAEEDIHAAVAAITMPNDASVALHEAFGFARSALLKEVGRKFGQYWDVLWMSRTF